MSVVSRSTLKAYFDTGDTITSATMNDLIDSMANLIDVSAQTFQSEIQTPSLVAAAVSAQTMAVAGMFQASAANLTGRVRHGVSAATSAVDTRGDVLVVQEATVTNATAQVAFLPTTSNIEGFGIKVIQGGSAAAGGLRVNVGNSDSRDYFGTISVSAVGLYNFTLVSGIRLTGVSGRVEMVCSGASAGTNVVGFVRYFQR